VRGSCRFERQGVQGYRSHRRGDRAHVSIVRRTRLRLHEPDRQLKPLSQTGCPDGFPAAHHPMRPTRRTSPRSMHPPDGACSAHSARWASVGRSPQPARCRSGARPVPRAGRLKHPPCRKARPRSNRSTRRSARSASTRSGPGIATRGCSQPCSVHTRMRPNARLRVVQPPCPWRLLPSRALSGRLKFRFRDSRGRGAV
jgi:hypothetical protein